MSNGESKPNLVRLSETNETVADPNADVRGSKVMDRNGDDAGKVDDLLIDDREHKVRFLRVGAGGFLGIGEDHYLVPVDAIQRIEDDQVKIDRQRTDLNEVPTYDPTIAYDRGYYGDLYGWWGYSPYWTAGYTYPAYPGYPPR